MAGRARSEILCLVVGFGLLVSLFVFQAASHTMTANINGRLAIVRAMACFPAGVALYRVGAFKPGAESGDRWGATLALASAALLLLVLLIPGAAMLAPLCFAGIIMGVRFGKGVINRLLCSRIAMFLGEISFALYLVHLEPLNLLLWNVERFRLTPTKALVALAVYLAVIILISFVLHEWVELPTQRFGRRLIARRFGRPAPRSPIEQVDQRPIILPPAA
jgi:peptidoglycan/LPS O-acetylase OafA/YrhL